MLELIIIPIIFFAVFVQAVAGFGSGLIAMPLLIGVLGVEVAGPVFGLVALTGGILMLFRYRRDLRPERVWRIIVAAIPAIPIGVWISRNLPEDLVLGILGIVTIAYALYALFQPNMPRLKNRRWAYGVGFIAGILEGAYIVPGPPLVIYGSSQRWAPFEFKSNLQSIFLFGGVALLITYALNGDLTPIVWQHYAIAVPALILGQRVGFALDRVVNPDLFRRIVLVLLIGVGFSLIF